MNKLRAYSQFDNTRSTGQANRPRLHSQDVSNLPIPAEIYPAWLKERKDFQDTLRNYEEIDCLDICSICTKQFNLRTAVEIKALEQWSKKCYFFKGISKNARATICSRLKSKQFSEGEALITPGNFADCLYFIVKGRVVIEKNGVTVEIGQYNLVGESELMKSKVVSYSILAKTSVDCVFLTKNDFDILAFKSRLKEQYNFKENLKNIRCFSDLRTSKIEELCACMSIVQYSSNELIFDITQPASFFYYIRRGSVMVDLLITLQKKNNWPTGNKMWETLLTEEKYSRTVKEFSVGELFGERELVLDLPRETKAAAKKDRTVVYMFAKEDLREILNPRELEALLHYTDRNLASPEIAKKLKGQIAEYKLKFTALLEASDIKRVKRGRGLWDESISLRKDRYAKELIFRHANNMKSILKNKQFSLSQSPRRTAGTFYNSHY